MSNFSSTKDIKKSVLSRCGELIDGTSSYDSSGKVIEYINSIHHAIISGGNEFDVTVNESWPWARAKRPIILQLQAPYQTGTVNLTRDSVSGTFSDAPTLSLEGWFLWVAGRSDVYRIVKHAAGGTTFQLDSVFMQNSTGAAFVCVQLEYDLVNDYFIVDTSNNKLDFKETSVGSIVTATLTTGNYSAAALATHVGSVMTSASLNASTYTCAFNTATRKFSISTSGSFLSLLFDTGGNVTISPADLLGFNVYDYTAATSYTSENVANGISRICDVSVIYEGITHNGQINMIEFESMLREYPLQSFQSGVPDRVCVVQRKPNGIVTVRFNRYPLVDNMRAEINIINIPRDLKDSDNSIPLLPRDYRSILDFGATYFLMLDKVDDRAQAYFNLAQVKIKGLVNAYRKESSGGSEFFGKTVPRRDMIKRRYLRNVQRG